MFVLSFDLHVLVLARACALVRVLVRVYAGFCDARLR